MSWVNNIIKKNPNKAKCMDLFLSTIKRNKEEKEIFISETMAKEYTGFEDFLNVMQKQKYINWETVEEGYQIELTPFFFKTYAPVLKML